MKMRVLPAVCLSLMLVVVRTADLHAQKGDDSQPESASARTVAINEADSRAEQEAERLVSLAPEKIIFLLEQEPGLFLEVKRMLVRKAYAQGQLLDAKALTDEAVFRMVRDDEETRALITQQITEIGASQCAARAGRQRRVSGGRTRKHPTESERNPTRWPLATVSARLSAEHSIPGDSAAFFAANPNPRSAPSAHAGQPGKLYRPR